MVHNNNDTEIEFKLSTFGHCELKSVSMKQKF